MIQQLDSAVRTMYTSTISKYISEDTRNDVLVPLYYRILSRISGEETVIYDNKSIRVSEYDVKNIQSQLRAEKKVLEAFLNETENKDVVYDIGANLGLYSLILGRVSNKVHAFEPQHTNFFRLRNNIKRNEMESKILCHNVALGEKEENFDTTYGMTTFRLKNTSNKSKNKIKVVSGDKYKREQNIEIPNIIKIDVEGFEKNVLSGFEQTLQEPQCRTLFIEVHKKVMGEEALSENEINDMYSYLEDFGFSISTIQDKGEQSNILATK